MFDFDAMESMSEQASNEEDDEESPLHEESPETPGEALQPSPHENTIVSEPAAEMPQPVPEASANPVSDSGDAQLLPFDTLTNAVLYIVQMEFPATPQEVWIREGFARETRAGGIQDGSTNTYLGDGRSLSYLPNGICIAQEIDFKKSVEPVRLELIIWQSKAGSNLQAARKIQDWSSATRSPLLQFTDVWELMPSNNGTSTIVRRSIKNFEQLQNKNVPLGELVILSIDNENQNRLRKYDGYDGPKAQDPSNYILFSAPATAELLEGVSIGKSTKILQSLLAKRADANHICDPSDHDSEMTPLTAAVEAGSLVATQLLLKQGGADPNVVCCQSGKMSESSMFFTAIDVARKVPHGSKKEIEKLLHDAGGVPMSKFDSQGNPNHVGKKRATNLESIDIAEFERVVRELEAELRLIRRKPAKEQRALFRKLLVEWHPDKNQGREALATSVFQWLQQAALSTDTRRNAGGVFWRTGRNQVPQDKQMRMRQRRQRRNREKRPPRRRAASPNGTPIEPPTTEMSAEMRIGCRNWFFEFVEVLLHRGQSVHQVDKDGRTALFYAVRGVRSTNGRMQQFPQATADLQASQEPGAKKIFGDIEVDMITFIVEDCEGDVNARDNRKRTPLMEAARFGCVHTCELLLDAKADINARDLNGKSALDIARLPAPQYCDTKEDEWIAQAVEGHEDGFEGNLANMRKQITEDRSKVATILEEELMGNSLGGVKRMGQLVK